MFANCMSGNTFNFNMWCNIMCEADMRYLYTLYEKNELEHFNFNKCMNLLY